MSSHVKFEAIHVQDTAIDDQHLAVIAHEIVSGTERRSRLLQSRWSSSLPKAFSPPLFLWAMRATHLDSVFHGRGERLGDLDAVEAEKIRMSTDFLARLIAARIGVAAASGSTMSFIKDQSMHVWFRPDSAGKAADEAAASVHALACIWRSHL